MRTDTPQSVALLNPAVSPVFNNNPAFRIYTGSNSNGDVVLDNYFQYYVDLVKANQQVRTCVLARGYVNCPG